MNQAQLLKTFLESNSGIFIISELIDQSPENIEGRTLKDLQANKDTKPILEKLTDKELNLLEDELNNGETGAKLQGFQTGVDLALLLTGNEPVYNVLPEKYSETKGK